MTAASPSPSAPSKRRARRLAFAAAATLAATVWAAVQDDDAASTPSPTRPVHRVASPAGATASAPPLAWPELPGAESRPAWHDALPQALAAWGPPPRPPQPPAPSPSAPAPAQPPEFPYTLIGRLDDGQPRALLTNRTRSFGAKAADVIDGTWRVDAVDPEGVTLTWLPGGISRTLAFPAS